MQVYLTSYATPNFEKVQKELNISALNCGIPNILTYDESYLKASEYYKENQSILDEVCGAGYWAWKPFVILEAIQKLKDGDILFYCDSGTLILESVFPLVDLCSQNKHGIILFDARPLTNRQFTKRDCFIKMDCDSEEHWNGKKIIATILVIRKSTFALHFLNEWLTLCRDRAVITNDPNICGEDNLSGYIDHRWDQAILSLLGSKYQLETFRNPTVWGNYLKMEQFRILGEKVIGPYYLVPEIQSYADLPQENSPYGTVFLINRQPNYVGKKYGPSIKKSFFVRVKTKVRKMLKGRN